MEPVTSLDRYRSSAERRRPTPRSAAVRSAFYFDLACPYTYLAAERAERLFSALAWVPAFSDALGRSASTASDARAVVARRAALLGLPLVWPLGPPVPVVGAMRVASLAAERGVGAAFVLAATRLVFCGGFNIEHPEILAEAAGAAGVDLGEMLHAAGDAGRDGAIEEAGRKLLAAGAERLPVLRVGRTLFCGEDRLSEAAAAAHATV